MNRISEENITDLNDIVAGFTEAFKIHLQKMGIAARPVLQLFIHDVPTQQMPENIMLTYSSKSVFIFREGMQKASRPASTSSSAKSV